MRRRVWARVVSVVLVVVMTLLITPISMTTSANAAVLGDDYPTYLKSASPDSINDPWQFLNRECTSFVAWRLNNANGIAFTNGMGGGWFGHGKTWGTNARNLGYTVDMNPTVGSVAWKDSGTYGHVAWVADVNGNSVTIEEYNYGIPPTYNYNKRTVAKTEFAGFIHFKDIVTTPPPAAPTVTGTPDIIVQELAVLTWNRPANTTNFTVDVWRNGSLWKRYYTNFTAHVEYFETETGQFQFFVWANGPGGSTASSQFNVNVARSDYIPVKTMVYDGHVYSLYDTSTSWFVARGIAESMGGHLVTTNDEAELAQIRNLITYGGKEWYWTDATDFGTEGTWSWSTGETTSVMPWNPNEPNNFDSDVGWGTENFGAIDKFSGNMNDLPAGFSTIRQGGFIVEVDDYSYVPHFTYNGHTYLRFDDVPNYLLPNGGLPWKEAKVFAERMGGHLATITSAEELEAMQPFLANGSKIAYYMGATDEAQEGVWTWVTGEEWSYTNWAPGEPNNVGGKQHYLLTYKDGTWDDGDYAPNYGVLVEIEPARSTVYNNHTYKLFERQMTWKDAKAYCESIGGHLATITSAGENAAIADLVTQGAQSIYNIGASDDVNTNLKLNYRHDPITTSDAYDRFS